MMQVPIEINGNLHFLSNLAWEAFYKLTAQKKNIFEYFSMAIDSLGPLYRDKGTPPKKGEGQVLLLQNYPHPLRLRGRGPYHIPTPLNI